jgi:hypothetical protein
MATRIQVQCITKPDRNNPHRHITHIGGLNSDGSRWKVTEERAIEKIRAGEWSFYVNRGDRTVNVVIEKHEDREYLKTENDGYRPDNLLALPECP